MLETWGEDANYLVNWSMPSQIGNDSFTRWMARLMRLAASPNDFVRQSDTIFNLDAGDAPERVSMRTMLDRSGDRGQGNPWGFGVWS